MWHPEPVHSCEYSQAVMVSGFVGLLLPDQYTQEAVEQEMQII